MPNLSGLFKQEVEGLTIIKLGVYNGRIHIVCSFEGTQVSIAAKMANIRRPIGCEVGDVIEVGDCMWRCEYQTKTFALFSFVNRLTANL